MTHFSHNNKKGFTLIELLVVIAIIGLLSSIVLGSLSSARTKAKAAKAQAELNQIKLVLEQYNNEYGGYPYPGSGLYCLGGSCTLAGVAGTELNTLSFKLDTTPTISNLAATVYDVSKYKQEDIITVNGVTYSGYVYVSCSNPIVSSSATSGYVCPGNSDDTDVSIITPVGNSVDTASARSNFVLSSYVAPTSGSDSGSDIGGSDGGYTDTDGDGVADSYPDNCIYTYNPGQGDANLNGIGDACEGSDVTDTDGDGVPDYGDNCPTTYNSDQSDYNYDGIGDACQGSSVADSDGDGIADNIDNCPSSWNPSQDDADANGVGDVCQGSY
ncbi:MAG: protein ral secretion pathway protein [Candidatus Parcubacteria bacterium]|jgi:prepilin-type N-terminal cleavage/methylation domain-containing protein